MSNEEGLSLSVRRYALKEWDSVSADKLMDGAAREVPKQIMSTGKLLRNKGGI